MATSYKNRYTRCLNNGRLIEVTIDFVSCWLSVCDYMRENNYSLSVDELFTKLKSLLDIESFNKHVQEQ